jgi:hypothetical protein
LAGTVKIGNPRSDAENTTMPEQPLLLTIGMIIFMCMDAWLLQPSLQL